MTAVKDVKDMDQWQLETLITRQALERQLSTMRPRHRKAVRILLDDGYWIEQKSFRRNAIEAYPDRVYIDWSEIRATFLARGEEQAPEAKYEVLRTVLETAGISTEPPRYEPEPLLAPLTKPLRKWLGR